MKIKAKDGHLVSGENTQHELRIATEEALRVLRGAEISQSSFRRLVWTMDMLAVMAPDNYNYEWCQNP